MDELLVADQHGAFDIGALEGTAGSWLLTDGLECGDTRAWSTAP